jgi:hypothetical protein
MTQAVEIIETPVERPNENLAISALSEGKVSLVMNSRY